MQTWAVAVCQDDISALELSMIAIERGKAISRWTRCVGRWFERGYTVSGRDFCSVAKMDRTSYQPGARRKGLRKYTGQLATPCRSRAPKQFSRWQNLPGLIHFRASAFQRPAPRDRNAGIYTVSDKEDVGTPISLTYITRRSTSFHFPSSRCLS